MTELNVVGHSVKRPDALDKVTGGKHFKVNYSLPGMLHAKLLRSPYPHARILNIDSSGAEKMAGVKLVITHENVPQNKFTPMYFAHAYAKSLAQDFVVMSDRVRWAGQPVAAVAATTAAIAEKALELIDVEYEELPAVFNPEKAMIAGAPQLYEAAPNNIAKNPVFSFGDLEAGFAEADHIFEGVYWTQRVLTCYMEPRVCGGL